MAGTRHQVHVHGAGDVRVDVVGADAHSDNPSPSNPSPSNPSPSNQSSSNPAPSNAAPGLPQAAEISTHASTRSSASTAVPGPRDAIVRVVNCGICGTDLRYVRLGGLIGPSDVPMPLGHELAGVVESVGDEVRDLSVGTRVVLNPTGAGHAIGNGGTEGGFTEHLLVRDAASGRALFPIPDDLPFHLAALAEPLGVGMNAVDRTQAKAGEKVAVFGAGPIGLAAIATLADRGIDDVVAVDLSERRLQVARELGAAHTINAGEENVWKRLKALHGEEPVLGSPMAATDAYIEASGAPSVIRQIIGGAKAESRLAIVALHDEDVPISILTVMIKQMTIRGAMEYPSDYTEMIRLLARRDLTPMITHRFPLAAFNEAFSVARDPEAGAKVMIDIDPNQPQT